MPCKTRRPLDKLIGMHYQVLCSEPIAEGIAEPRDRSFIVIEDLDYKCTGRGEYSIYLVLKRGIDSLTALNLLEKMLEAPKGSAQAAGFKDAAATTIQYVSIPASDTVETRVYRRNGRLMVARRICKTSIPLNPRMLRGNRFTIVLRLRRNIDPSRVKEVLTKLAETPIPGYYGYQRFGTIRPTTHLLGVAALYDDPYTYLKTIVDEPFPDEKPEHIARRLRSQGIPREYEELVLKSLRLSVANAIRTAHRYLRGLDYEALQALAFNLYISERIRRGIPLEEPIPGERVGREGFPLAIVPGKGFIPGKESRRIYDDALSPLGIGVDDLARIPSKGFWRPVAFRVEELRWTYTGSNLLVLHFKLVRGMYATIVLREIAFTPY